MSTQEAQPGGTEEAQPGGTEEAQPGETEEEQSGGAEEARPGETEEARPGGTAESGGAEPPGEEQMRAAYEAELSRITSADMVLQAAVSLLNIGARRLGLVGGAGGADSTAAQQPRSPERDLEQVRDAIDAVRGLMPVIERRASQEARPLRDALSQLQMAYAREAQGAAPAHTGAQGAPAGAPPTGAARGAPSGRPPESKPGGKPGPGPAETSGRLWVPGR